MFDKLLANICPAAHLYWIVALMTIVYGVIVGFPRFLVSPFASIISLLWSVFWVYIITAGLKKICEDGYEGFAYVLSVLLLVWWFNTGMQPPVRIN